MILLSSLSLKLKMVGIVSGSLLRTPLWERWPLMPTAQLSTAHTKQSTWRWRKTAHMMMSWPSFSAPDSKKASGFNAARAAALDHHMCAEGDEPGKGLMAL